MQPNTKTVGNELTYTILPKAPSRKPANYTYTYTVLTVILLQCWVFAGQLQAADLVIVQSSDLKPYNEAAAGILSVLHPSTPQGPKTLLGIHVETIVLEKNGTDENRVQEIREHRPNLILAIGKKALRLSLALTEIPVIHVMVPGALQLVQNRSNVSGISMIVPPRITLKKLHKAFPHIRRILVLYNPHYSSSFIRQAESEAELLRFKLTAIPVETSREVPGLLSSFNEQTDALWMIPDPNVLTAQTSRAYLDFSINKRVILISFAQKYFKNGASFAVMPDNTGMGQEAGLLALQVLQGEEVLHVSMKDPTAYRVFKNNDILKKIATLKPRSNPDAKR